MLLHSGVQITAVKQHVSLVKLQVSNQEDSEEMGSVGGKEFYNSSVWREHSRPVQVFSISDDGL